MGKSAKKTNDGPEENEGQENPEFDDVLEGLTAIDQE